MDRAESRGNTDRAERLRTTANEIEERQRNRDIASVVVGGYEASREHASRAGDPGYEDHPSYDAATQLLDDARDALLEHGDLPEDLEELLTGMDPINTDDWLAVMEATADTIPDWSRVQTEVRTKGLVRDLAIA